MNTPFVIPNIRAENPEAATHTRIGWFRSVSNIPHAFAVQSFVAELAHAAGRDPKDYLLELIGPPRVVDPTDLGDVWNHGEDPKVYTFDTGRLRRVVETAAAGIGWGCRAVVASTCTTPSTTATRPSTWMWAPRRCNSWTCM